MEKIFFHLHNLPNQIIRILINNIRALYTIFELIIRYVPRLLHNDHIDFILRSILKQLIRTANPSSSPEHIQNGVLQLNGFIDIVEILSHWFFCYC